MSWGKVLEVTEYILLALSEERCLQQLHEALQLVRVIRQAEFTARQTERNEKWVLHTCLFIHIVHSINRKCIWVKYFYLNVTKQNNDD